MQSLLNVQFGSNSRGIILFGFEIYYYAIFIVFGMLVATFLSALLMKRRNMSPDLIFTLFLVCIPSALVCARLYYCITDGMPVKEWINIRDGGLSIIGGALGGIGAGLIVCLVKKINFFRAADCVVICILVGQIFGRWGNYFNQEVYGGVVANEATMGWFPFAVFIEADGKWHYAFFFYEMFFNCIAFALLYTAAWKWAKKPNGLFTFAYFAWYGLLRTVMEPLRDPAYILKGGGVPWSLVTSVLMLIGGLAGIIVIVLRNYAKEGALFGSKEGDPCAITQYLSPDKKEQPYFSKINMLGHLYPPKPAKGASSTAEPPKNDDEGGGTPSASSHSTGSQGDAERGEGNEEDKK